MLLRSWFNDAWRFYCCLLLTIEDRVLPAVVFNIFLLVSIVLVVSLNLLLSCFLLMPVYSGTNYVLPVQLNPVWPQPVTVGCFSGVPSATTRITFCFGAAIYRLLAFAGCMCYSGYNWTCYFGSYYSIPIDWMHLRRPSLSSISFYSVSHCAWIYLSRISFSPRSGGSVAARAPTPTSSARAIFICCGLGTASILISLHGVLSADPGLPVAEGVTLSTDWAWSALSNLICGCKLLP